MAISITDDNFDDVVLRSANPVLVDFRADWCSGCRMLDPIIETLYNQYRDKIIVGKVDVDLNQAVAKRYGINHIPTLLFFKNGEIVDQYTGAAPEYFLQEKLNKQCH